MLYRVKRNNQEYGPYTLDDLKNYVASGNVLLTDLAGSDDTRDWVPVSQVLGVAPPAAVAPYAATPSQYPQTAAIYPDPPNLHWALVLLIGLFTCGLFNLVWIFVQAIWVRKVDPNSKALIYYIAGIALDVVSVFTQISLSAAQAHGNAGQSPVVAVSLVSTLAMAVLFIVANFSMRDSIEAHFNGPEPIGLSLSGVMTFFFGSLYFQYHFTRINELKRMARYRGAAI